MIEINLIEQKKAFKAPVVLGVDLAKVPFVKIIVTYIVTMVPLGFVSSYFEGELAGKEQEVTTLNATYRKLKIDLKKNANIKGELAAFNEQLQKLKLRSGQVDKIIKEKTNPGFLLEKIARNIPEDMWLNHLEVNAESEITIEGASDTYTSIGNFLTKMNDSPFFARSLQLADSQTKEEKVKGQNFRIEVFKIKGKVDVFDPFGKGR